MDRNSNSSVFENSVFKSLPTQVLKGSGNENTFLGSQNSGAFNLSDCGVTTGNATYLSASNLVKN